MPRKTIASLEAEVEQWKTMYFKELDKRDLADKKVAFLEKHSDSGILGTMAESLAKMAHAMGKVVEVDRTNNTSPF